jgi:hypothetical protein
MKSKTVFFIDQKYPNSNLEFGIIHQTDPDFIWLFNEPCKVPLSQCQIIPDSQIIFIEGYPFQKPISNFPKLHHDNTF